MLRVLVFELLLCCAEVLLSDVRPEDCLAFVVVRVGVDCVLSRVTVSLVRVLDEVLLFVVLLSLVLAGLYASELVLREDEVLSTVVPLLLL